MENNELISAKDFCSSHQVEVSLVSAFGEQGLIELVVVEREEFIPVGELEKTEQLLRLYHELDINLEGIEAISHLLQKINSLQTEVRQLRNRLRLYENE